MGDEGTWVKWVTAVVVTLLIGAVVLGGVRRIGRVAETLVPFMAGAYVLLGLAIVVINVEQIPAVFTEIIGQAFTRD